MPIFWLFFFAALLPATHAVPFVAGVSSINDGSLWYAKPCTGLPHFLSTPCIISICVMDRPGSSLPFRIHCSSGIASETLYGHSGHHPYRSPRSAMKYGRDKHTSRKQCSSAPRPDSDVSSAVKPQRKSIA